MKSKRYCCAAGSPFLVTILLLVAGERSEPAACFECHPSCGSGLFSQIIICLFARYTVQYVLYDCLYILFWIWQYSVHYVTKCSTVCKALHCSGHCSFNRCTRRIKVEFTMYASSTESSTGKYILWTEV